MKKPLLHLENGKLFWKDLPLPLALIALIFASLLYNPSYLYQPYNPWPFYFIPQESIPFLTLALFLPGCLSKGFPYAGKDLLSKSFYGAILLYFASIALHILPDFSRHGLWNLGLLLFPPAILLFFLRQKEEYPSGKLYAGILIPFGLLNLHLLASANMMGYSQHMRSGITGNSNWTAATTVISLAAMCAFLHTFLRKKYSTGTSWFLLGLPLIGGAFLWKYLGSLGSLLAILATGYFVIGLLIPTGRIRKYTLMGALLLGLLGSLLFLHHKQDAVVDRFASDERLLLWEGTVNMILANPITGAGGSCCYENKFIPYKPLEYFLKSFVAPRANHPHNEFLYILASGGILGGLPLLFLLLFPVFFLYKKYWKQRPDSWDLLLFAMYLYLLIHGQVDCFFPKYPMQLFVWMLCGCAWSNVFRLNGKNALLPRLPEDGKGEK